MSTEENNNSNSAPITLSENRPENQNNTPIIDETVTAHMARIIGNQSSQYIPTQAQVDKILSLQEKGMDYTHEERTVCSPKQKIQLTMFMVIIIVLIIIFTLSLFYAKEYLGEIISGTVGILAGGIGGYGIAGRYKNNNDKE